MSNPGTETAKTTETDTVTADAARLLRAFSNVALFAGTDDTLPCLLCLHLTATNGTLTVEATDRYALAEETIPGAPGTLDVLISAKDTLTATKPLTAALKTSARLPGYMAGQPVITVTIDGKYARLTLTGHLAPDLSVTVPVTDAMFPRTSSRWPADTDSHGEQCTGQATFTSAKLARLAKVDDGENLKYRYVRFTYASPSRPAVVHIGGSFRALVMPVVKTS